MLAAGAFSANEYAMEKEKKMTFSIKCHKVLLKHKKDYLLNNMLVNNMPKVVSYHKVVFSKGTFKRLVSG